MARRTLLILVTIGSLSVTLWGQGNSCHQYQTWFYSTGAGTGTEPVFWPSSIDTQNMEQLQAQYGGDGPICSAEIQQPPYWTGGCHSIAWTCAPPPPPVGGCETCLKAGHPIDLGSGNVFIQQTDVRLAGLGGGLSLTRTWNSEGGSSGRMFGSGWRSNFEESIQIGSDGLVAYLRSDGSTWYFAFYGNPPMFQLISPADRQALLTEQGVGGWVITFQNGEKRVFAVSPPFLDPNGHYQNNSGPLTSIIDRNGNATALNYDQPQPGTLGRLLSVTDAAGRSLYFTYGSAGYVTNVASDSNAGINVTYAYTSDALTQVTQTDGTFMTFNYDAAGNILNVNDSQGKVLEAHTYDLFRRGLSSSRANGVEALTVSYP